ncbi:MAG: ABC transporter permease [SAR202 cluster bacterium]|nr:ABC transporter permease [SAR202 cluster bacterium]MDP6714256.1 ABC transporter permease [SAR202 cluster bacterium]
MAIQTRDEASAGAATQPQLITGWTKFARDIGSIFEIKLIMFVRAWYWYIVGVLVFPLGMFYFARALAPDTPDAVRRAMVGTIVFGATMLTTNMLAQNVMQDRFQGRLKLVITMPVSRISYAVGVLLFGFMLSASTVMVLLVVALLAGVDFTLSWAFLPIVIAVLLGMSGLTLFIVSYAPNAEVGGLMANLMGVLMAFISPVYFPMEQAPALMKAFGWISPLRYAADGMMKSLSGQNDVFVELVILAGFAIALLSAGLWKLRWRES